MSHGSSCRTPGGQFLERGAVRIVPPNLYHPPRGPPCTGKWRDVLGREHAAVLDLHGLRDTRLHAEPLVHGGPLVVALGALGGARALLRQLEDGGGALRHDRFGTAKTRYASKPQSRASSFVRSRMFGAGV